MIVVCISGLGLSALLVYREETAVRRVGALVRFLEFVGSSVRHYSMSASEILSGCDGELLFLCGLNDGGDRPESFPEMAERCEIPDDESARIFMEFAEGFGRSYREEQAAKCDGYIARLAEREGVLRDALPSRRKMIIVLGVSITLAIVILLM